MNVRSLSDSDLLSGTHQLLGSRRRLTAKLLQCLGEVEARSLHIKEAYSSMYDFCVNGLAMSEGEAHRTLAAARAVRRFPVALQLVRDGLLHLSGLELLHKYLTPQNHAALLEAACNKSKRQIEEMIRAHFPRPDVPPRVQAIIGERAVADEVGHAAGTATVGPAAPDEAARVAAVTAPQVSAPSQEPRGTTRLRPLSADRYHVEFTVDAAFRDQLERVQDLLRHQNPRGDLAWIFEHALDLLQADVEKKRLGKPERPRRVKPAKHGAISRAARREVFQRDGERCTYVSPSGRRCTSRAFIELDHRVARAQGGSGKARNLRVRCRAHNLFEAKQVFGEAHVDDMIRRSRCECGDATRGREDAIAGVGDARSSVELTGLSDDLRQQRSTGAVQRSFDAATCAKLVSGLTRMGFRERAARRAVGVLVERHAGRDGELGLAELFKEALAILTT
jgi:hypothetical protein